MRIGGAYAYRGRASRRVVLEVIQRFVEVVGHVDEAARGAELARAPLRLHDGDEAERRAVAACDHDILPIRGLLDEFGEAMLRVLEGDGLHVDTGWPFD